MTLRETTLQTTILEATTSNLEDTTGASGWSVSNDGWDKLVAGWSTITDSLKIRVNGYALTLPAVTAVAIASTPPHDEDGDNTPETYGLGDTIEVQVTFDKTVAVDTAGGTPRLKIKMDPAFGEKWADYERGTGSKTLTFAYTVEDPNKSPGGIAVLEDTLELNGGTMRLPGGTGNNAKLAHTGLAHDAAHKVDYEVTGGDSTPPGFSSAAVNGATLTVAFDESLDGTSVPAPGAFTVTVAGSARAVASGGVSVAGTTVTLRLASAVTNGQAVTVAYTQPDKQPPPGRRWQRRGDLHRPVGDQQHARQHRWRWGRWRGRQHRRRRGWWRRWWRQPPPRRPRQLRQDSDPDCAKRAHRRAVAHHPRMWIISR